MTVVEAILRRGWKVEVGPPIFREPNRNGFPGEFPTQL